ncbi:MAG: InlB B-repeat-containing protein [Oscillospiraceae bacterium]|nr:InlB B-repeat-containing protein [Oscillospiraceae bacterium]
MKRTRNRVVSLFLVIAMAFTLIPTNAVFASQTGHTVTFYMNGGTGTLDGVAGPATRIVADGGTIPTSGTDAYPIAANTSGANVIRPDYILDATPQWFDNPSCTGTAWVFGTGTTANVSRVYANTNLYLRWKTLHGASFNYSEVLPKDIKNPSALSFERFKEVYDNRLPDGEALSTAMQAQIAANANLTTLANYDHDTFDPDLISTHRSAVQNVRTGAPRTKDFLFDKWYTDSELKVPFVANSVISSPLNLFAGWIPANNVRFDLNYENYPLNDALSEKVLENTTVDGENPNRYFLNIVRGSGTTAIDLGHEIQVLDKFRIPNDFRPENMVTTNRPNRQNAGWEFLGWYLDATYDDIDVEGENRKWDMNKDRIPENIGNLTLYAHWERQVDVTFDYNFAGYTPPTSGSSAGPDKLTAAQRPIAGKPIPSTVLTGNRINPTYVQAPTASSANYRKPNLVVVVDEDTGEPIMDPDSGDPFIDEDTGLPIIDEDTGEPIIDPDTMTPLMAPLTCPYWDTLCSYGTTAATNPCCRGFKLEDGTDDEGNPVMVNTGTAGYDVNRHGFIWSLEGWYPTPEGPNGPEGENEKWVFSSGSGATAIVGTPAKNVDFTLYAHWVPSYEVSYVLGKVDHVTDLNTPANYTPFRYVAPTGKTLETTAARIDAISSTLTGLVAKRNILANESSNAPGWFKEDTLLKRWNTGGTTKDILEGDTTLYAGWLIVDDDPITKERVLSVDDGTLRTYQITFDANGGTGGGTRRVPNGGTGKQLYNNTANNTQTISAPTRKNYQFTGWFSDEECTKEWNDGLKLTEDITVYAGWTRKITIQFYAHWNPECEADWDWPNRPGCVCCNVLQSGQKTLEFLDYNIGDTHYLTKFTEINQGGVAVNPITEGNKNGLLDGHTAISWCLCGDPECKDDDCVWDFTKQINTDIKYTTGEKAGEDILVEEDDMLYLRLYINAEKAIQVRYNLNWPEGTGEPPPPGLAEDHWRKGFLTTSTGSGANIEYYEILNQISKSSTIPTPPSTYLSAASNKGNNMNVPQTKEVWTFVGWYTAPQEANNLNAEEAFKFGASGAGTLVDANTILYAGWEKGFSVEFNAGALSQGEKVDVPSTLFLGINKVITNPNPTNDPNNDPKRDGKRFTAWYIDKECTVPWSWSKVVDKDIIEAYAKDDVITLYAGWINVYNVSFNFGTNITNPEPILVEEGGKVTNPILPPRDGYAWGGWYRDEESAKEDVLDQSKRWDLQNDVVVEDIILHGGWVKRYNVSFEYNYPENYKGSAGVPYNVQQVWDGAHFGKFAENNFYITRVTKPVNIPGYSFVGWYSEPYTLNKDDNLPVEFLSASPWVFSKDYINLKDGDERKESGKFTLYACWTTKDNVNPLLEKLEDIEKAAEEATPTNAKTVEVNMFNGVKTWYDMPKVVLEIIKDKNVNLDLLFPYDGYTLHIRGTGLTVTPRNYNLSLNIEYGIGIEEPPCPWILAPATKAATENKYVDERNRPIWQMNIVDCRSILYAVTLEPKVAKDNHFGKWEYAIMTNRSGSYFYESAFSKLDNDGSFTFVILTNTNEHIIVFNDTSSAIILCEVCKNDVDRCTCPPETTATTAVTTTPSITTSTSESVTVTTGTGTVTTDTTGTGTITTDTTGTGTVTTDTTGTDTVTTDTTGTDTATTDTTGTGTVTTDSTGTDTDTTATTGTGTVTTDTTGAGTDTTDTTGTGTDTTDTTDATGTGTDDTTDTTDSTGTDTSDTETGTGTSASTSTSIGTVTTTPPITTDPSETTESTEPPEPKYGVISNEGEGEGAPTIFCFIEILLYLVKMPSNAANNPAAILSPEGEAAGEPTIFCGIEILLYIVGLPTYKTLG